MDCSSAGTPLLTADTTTSVVDGSTKYLAANGLNMSFAYDPFGNIRQSGNWSFQQAYATANQLSGWTYDAAGNLLVDSYGNQYSYDANGPVATVSGPRVESVTIGKFIRSGSGLGATNFCQ